MGKETSIHIRIEKALLDAIDAQAKAELRNRSNMVLFILTDYVRRQKETGAFPEHTPQVLRLNETKAKARSKSHDTTH